MRDIREILGQLDSTTMSAIQRTRITAAELVEVREWMDADPIIRSQVRHGASGAVAAVCDILADEERVPNRER